MATSGELLRPLLISKIRGIKRSVMLLAKATGHVVASVSRQKEAIRANPAHNHRIDTVGCFNHMYLYGTLHLKSMIFIYFVALNVYFMGIILGMEKRSE
uniref:Uncharacterized protein n=1 Tax=Triticum urartu TaxID=4572 RepID=A0A8R7PLZ3_TRIUA